MCLENGSIYQKLELGRGKEELAHHSTQTYLSQMFSLLPTLLAFGYHLQPNLLDGKDEKAMFSIPFSTFTNLGLVSTWMNEAIQECSAFSCSCRICSIIVHSSKLCFLLQMKTEGLNVAPVITKDEGKYLCFHEGEVSISSRTLLTSLIRTSLR